MIGVRLQPDQLAALDRWIESQAEPRPTRPEAIRQLIDTALDRDESSRWLTEGKL